MLAGKSLRATSSVGDSGKKRYRLKIVQDVIREGIDRRASNMAGRIASGERVAVRRGPNNPRNADGRPGSSHILDNRRLAERLAQAFRKNAGNHVGGSPGRERHDQRDRPVGIALCSDDALKGQLRARARGQLQESTTVKHIELPALQVSAAYHDATRRKSTSRASAAHRAARPGALILIALCVRARRRGYRCRGGMPKRARNARLNWLVPPRPQHLAMSVSERSSLLVASMSRRASSSRRFNNTARMPTSAARSW